MINTVIKRDGRIVEFDKTKVTNAILGAMKDVDNISRDVANRITNDISKLEIEEIHVEDLQDLVEEKLMASKMKDVARTYVRYRYDREKNRALSKDLNERYNEFISLIKETSVVTFIAIMDVTKVFQDYAGSSSDFFTFYITLAVIYLVIVLLITLLIKVIEKRLRRNER